MLRIVLSALVHPKLYTRYIVTHWESGLRQEIAFEKGGELKRFLISVGIRFNLGTVSRLYALYPNTTHENKTKIDSTEELTHVLNSIDSNNDYLEILYVYPENKSPTSHCRCQG